MFKTKTAWVITTTDRRYYYHGKVTVCFPKRSGMAKIRCGSWFAPHKIFFIPLDQLKSIHCASKRQTASSLELTQGPLTGF